VPADQALPAAAEVAAARPAEHWDHDARVIADRLWTSTGSVADILLAAATR